MLFKMDNTTVYTLSIPLLFSILFGYVHHFNHLYVSNTKMIIRQSEQIQFLLGRVIELDKKIKGLKPEIIIEDEECIEEDECIEEECIEEDECIEEELEEEEKEKEKENEIEEEENEIEEKEKDFELIESNSTFKISKNNGWLRFIF